MMVVRVRRCPTCGRSIGGSLAQAVLMMFDANPNVTSYQIAEAVECDPADVRAVLRKHGRKLARKRGQRPSYRKAADTQQR